MKLKTPPKKSRTAEASGSLESQISHLAAKGKLAAAARRAIRAQRARGLPITFKRGNKIIRQHPNGQEELLQHLTATKRVKLPAGVRILGKK
jgi:hypothetical protein